MSVVDTIHGWRTIIGRAGQSLVMVTIERTKAGARTEDCLRLARKLEEGFNENGLATMAEDLPGQRTVVALDDGDVVGFVSIDECNPNVSELGWFAVAEDRQGEGIGTELLADVYDDRRAAGVELLAVKTLADTVESENYARTRAFYEKEGFRHVETIDPFPGWDPGNPCAIYVKPL
jgi:GNAT superfamily N-acetyltransferase